jgi:SAM-dependent methyltransferase
MRAEIRRLGPWHHDVEVVPGIRTGEVTKGIVYPPSFGRVSVIQPELWMSDLVKDVFPQGLEGRSILDCACNGGGYLFEAARRGMDRGFGFDVRDHWINQARFLAQHAPDANLQFATADVNTLPELKLDSFDITLFMGLFYHLPDPMTSLRIAADRTTELLVLNTAIRPGGGDALALKPESTTNVMSGVHRLAWVPTSDAVLREILGWCGFPHTRVTRYEQRKSGLSDRVEIFAAREASTFAHFDTRRQEVRVAPRSGRLARAWRRVLRRA